MGGHIAKFRVRESNGCDCEGRNRYPRHGRNGLGFDKRRIRKGFYIIFDVGSHSCDRTPRTSSLLGDGVKCDVPCSGLGSFIRESVGRRRSVDSEKPIIHLTGITINIQQCLSAHFLKLRTSKRVSTESTLLFKQPNAPGMSVFRAS